MIDEQRNRAVSDRDRATSESYRHVTMVLTEYAKRRILLFEAEGYRTPTISKMLKSEGIFISRQGVTKVLLRVKATGSITRQAGSGRPTKLTREVKEIV